MVVLLIHVIFNILVKPKYQIDEKGITYTDGYRHVRLAWSEIEWYYFKVDALTPELSSVQFGTIPKKHKKAVPAFVFDTRLIDEQALRNLVEAKLNGKDLYEVSKRKVEQRKLRQEGPWT